MLDTLEPSYVAIALVAVLVVIILLRPKKQAEVKKPVEPAPEVVDEEAEKAFTPMKIFFGSQTGTAESYSHRLAQEAKSYKFKPQVIDLDGYNFSDFEKEDLCVFVCSTYGEGEPPDNAREFWNHISNSDLPKNIYSNMRFLVFGLGNKTYDFYNTFGRGIDRRLEELGATRLVARGEGDDDGNLEEDFLAWKEKMWPELCAKVGISGEKVGGDLPTFNFRMVIHDQDYLPKVNRERSQSHAMKMSVDARILVNRELHTEKSDRSCRHIEIDCVESNLSYETGDHLAVFPHNHHEIVKEYADRLDIDLDTMFTMEPVDPESTDKSPFPSSCTVRDALTKYCDITSPASKHVLQVLAHYATDAGEKSKLKLLAGTSEESKAKYAEYIKKGVRNVLEVLLEHPSVNVPVGHLLQALPSLQCRYYSISSSSRLHPTSIHITAVLVEYKAPTNRYKYGVCTKWLSELRPHETTAIPVTVKCLVRKSGFRPPLEHTTPVIMVGPGTGIAPFRGFIQDRHYLRKQLGADAVGPTVLFFGCRSRDLDYLYEDELLSYTRDGSLTGLHVAFSREKERKEYVQHKIVEEKESIFDLIYTKKGYFYICGDAQRMARDVRQALVDIICEFARLGEEEGKKYVDSMQHDGRLQLDVWS